MVKRQTLTKSPVKRIFIVMWSADKQHSLTQHIYVMSEVEMEKMKMVFFLKKKNNNNIVFFCILPKVRYNIIRDFVLARITYICFFLQLPAEVAFSRRKKKSFNEFFFPELQIICTAIHHLRPFNSSNGHFSSRTRLLPYKQKLKKNYIPSWVFHFSKNMKNFEVYFTKVISSRINFLFLKITYLQCNSSQKY